MSFTQQLREKANPIWEKSFNHPFVQGIVKGELEIEKFRYYVIQDSYYLSQFARVQAAAAMKALTNDTTNRLVIHAENTGLAEQGLHQTFMKELNITEEEQERLAPAPTAYAYTSHLYRAALLGNTAEIIAALLPCYWLYYEIGQRFKDEKPENPIYQQWITTYGSEWFGELVLEQIKRLDELAEHASDEELARMTENFIISSEYELAFWQMGYTMEPWGSKQSQTTRA